jgi:hypothetical protein
MRNLTKAIESFCGLFLKVSKSVIILKIEEKWYFMLYLINMLLTLIFPHCRALYHETNLPSIINDFILSLTFLY